jgi:Cd2+/Zn2+-exporting ATPase
MRPEQVPHDDAVIMTLEALDGRARRWSSCCLANGRRVDRAARRTRGDAKEAVTTLHRLGIETVMLTGDNRRTAQAIGAALGVRPTAELLREAKLEQFAALHERGSIAMVGGTDVALETAETALLHNRVTGSRWG